jgi:hypothetical protein
VDKDIINAVYAAGPVYNEYLLRGFMVEQIAGAAEFVGTVFREAVKLFNGVITYTGLRVVPPADRAEWELTRNQGCRIANSELLLVEYLFNYAGREYKTPLYIPYLKNDVIVIDDTNYVLQRSIKEQVASRTTNGITMKVIRQPIPFYRTASYRMESASDNRVYNESVPTTSIHRNKLRSKGKTSEASIIHYLFCKFGFIGTLARFGVAPEDCSFVSVMAGDIERFRYFPARKVLKKRQPDLFLRVHKDLLDNPLLTRFIANILYTITSTNTKYSLENLYEPTGTIFRVMLGKITHGANVAEIAGNKKIEDHIASLDSYLDPITRVRLHEYGILVSDIYDLLQYVFTNINEIIRTTSHTNLYHSRIDYLEELLVETIVKSVYGRWYDAVTDPKKLNEKEVKSILFFAPNLIAKLHTSRIVQKNPPAYGDNALVGWLIQKIRQSGLSASGHTNRSPDHRFHTSMAVVESLIALSKSNPGAGGSINPYLPITRNGSVIRPDYAEEIDTLSDYLPY